jgi:hypothetical protein
MPDFCNLQQSTRAAILSTLARLGIRLLHNILLLQLQEDSLWDQRLLRARGIAADTLELMLALLDQIAASEIIPEDSHCEAAGAWSWTTHEQNNTRFQIPNALAYNLLVTASMDTPRRNVTWTRVDPDQIWEVQWAKLWASDLSYRAKIFSWRVLAKGLFTGARAILMGHQEAQCKACPTELETIPHLFETCSHAKKSWTAMSALYASRGQTFTLPPQSLLIECN